MSRSIFQKLRAGHYPAKYSQAESKAGAQAWGLPEVIRERGNRGGGLHVAPWAVRALWALARVQAKKMGRWLLRWLSGSLYWFSPSSEKTSITNIKCFNKSKGKIYWMRVLFIREDQGEIKPADPPERGLSSASSLVTASQTGKWVRGSQMRQPLGSCLSEVLEKTLHRLPDCLPHFSSSSPHCKPRHQGSRETGEVTAASKAPNQPPAWHHLPSSTLQEINYFLHIAMEDSKSRMKGLRRARAKIRTQVSLETRPLCLRFFSWKHNLVGIYFSFPGFE